MKKILIVEDEKFISNMYARLFSTNGYAVEVVTDGVIALENLNNTNLLPSVILLDINLPNMNGREFLIKIKEIHKFKKIPVVILTNTYSEEAPKEFLNLGANLFLVKSQYSPSEIIDNVKKVLED